MNAIWIIAGKDLRQRLRDRSAILLAIVLPLGLAFIFSLIIGSSATPRPFRYTVVDLDRGPAAQAFTQTFLPQLASEGLVELTAGASRAEAWTLTDSGDADAAFVIEPGFPASGGIEIIAGKDSPMGAQVARSLAQSYTAEIDAVRLSVAAVGPSSSSSAQQLAQRAMAAPRRLPVQDVSAPEKILSLPAYFAAGMAIFFLFFTVQYGVMSLLDERQQGTLGRLLAAPVSARAILAGKLTTSFLLGLISTSVLVAATSLLMGAEWGDPVGVGLLVVSGVLAATGITALVASIARTPELAGNWQSVIAVVLGLLGGVFFPVAQGGAIVARLSLITPHAWFLRGLAELAGGATVAGVLPAVGALLTFAAVTLTIATVRLGKVMQP